MADDDVDDEDFDARASTTTSRSPTTLDDEDVDASSTTTLVVDDDDDDAEVVAEEDDEVDDEPAARRQEADGRGGRRRRRRGRPRRRRGRPRHDPEGPHRGRRRRRGRGRGRGRPEHRATGETADGVTPKKANEFMCTGCFLLVNRGPVRPADNMTCPVGESDCPAIDPAREAARSQAWRDRQPWPARTRCPDRDVGHRRRPRARSISGSSLRLPPLGFVLDACPAASRGSSTGVAARSVLARVIGEYAVRLDQAARVPRADARRGAVLQPLGAPEPDAGMPAAERRPRSRRRSSPSPLPEPPGRGHRSRRLPAPWPQRSRRRPTAEVDAGHPRLRQPVGVAGRAPARGLTPDELEAVRRYESEHRGRKTILNKIAQLQAELGLTADGGRPAGRPPTTWPTCADSAADGRRRARADSGAASCGPARGRAPSRSSAGLGRRPGRRRPRWWWSAPSTTSSSATASSGSSALRRRRTARRGRRPLRRPGRPGRRRRRGDDGRLVAWCRASAAASASTRVALPGQPRHQELLRDASASPPGPSLVHRRRSGPGAGGPALTGRPEVCVGAVAVHDGAPAAGPAGPRPGGGGVVGARRAGRAGRAARRGGRPRGARGDRPRGRVRSRFSAGSSASTTRPPLRDPRLRGHRARRTPTPVAGDDAAEVRVGAARRRRRPAPRRRPRRVPARARHHRRHHLPRRGRSSLESALSGPSTAAGASR